MKNKHRWKFRGKRYDFCVKCLKKRYEVHSWNMIPCNVSSLSEKRIEENIRYYKGCLAVKDVLE